MSLERIVIRIGSALLLASGLACALIPGVFAEAAGISASAAGLIASKDGHRVVTIRCRVEVLPIRTDAHVEGVRQAIHAVDAILDHRYEGE